MMNVSVQVYMTFTEQKNFVKGLAALLGLPPDSGTNTCMAAAQAAIAQLHSSSPEAVADLQQQIRHLQQELQHQQQSHQQAAAAAGHVVSSETAAALERLKAAFGVAGEAQLAEAGEKLVGRLRRLDEVLPRYQRVTSALYEMLRVRGLEELVPAVQRLMMTAGQ